MSQTDDFQEYYNKEHLATISRRGYYQEKIDFFLRQLGDSKKDNLQILDIGCNDGELTKLYESYGNVLGTDINKKAIEQCKKKGLNCLCISTDDLVRTHKNSFDIVIAGDIIEHIFDTDAFLQSIYKLLKKDGILLLTTPNLASIGRRIMLLIGKNPFIEFSTKLPSEEINVGHIRYYTISNIEYQLKENRFNDIQIFGDRINVLPGVYVPYTVAKFFPTLSRNFLICAKKS